MTRFCYIHAADLHLDTPFEGFKKTAPELHEALLDASLNAWDALVDLALEREAAFLLLAGDIYDGADRGLRAQLRFRRGVAKLCNAGTQVFAVHGNHDPVEEGWSAIRDWPEGFTVFSTSEVSSVGVEHDGERIATIYGQSYARRDTTENLSLGFRCGAEAGLHIAMLHCNVGGASGHENYSPCSVEDLCNADMDYWALGHVHQHAIVREGDPWIVYPGNLQGRSPQPGERGAKGAVVVEVDAGRVVSATHTPLDSVRFVHPSVDVSGCGDLGALEELLASVARSQQAEIGARALMLRVNLRGADERLAADLARSETMPELVTALRERFEGLSPFMWWESIRAETSAQRVDIQVDDFAASLEEVFTSVIDDAAEASALIDSSLDKLPSRRKGVEFPPLDVADHEGLLRAGREIALERLSGGHVPGSEAE